MSSSLDLDLEQYVVPTPSTPVVYAANLTENPRSLNNIYNHPPPTIKVLHFWPYVRSFNDVNLKSCKVIIFIVFEF